MSLSTDDRLAIHELLSLHGHISDDRRPADLDQLLTDDVVYDVTAYGLGAIHGLAAYRKLWESLTIEQPAGHHVTNVIVAEQPDGVVRVRSKGLAVMAGGRTGTVTYEDVVVKTPSGWRISHRTIVPPRTAAAVAPVARAD